jgi:hypothetical protein
MLFQFYLFFAWNFNFFVIFFKKKKKFSIEFTRLINLFSLKLFFIKEFFYINKKFLLYSIYLKKLSINSEKNLKKIKYKKFKKKKKKKQMIRSYSNFNFRNNF